MTPTTFAAETVIHTVKLDEKHIILKNDRSWQNGRLNYNQVAAKADYPRFEYCPVSWKWIHIELEVS